MARDGSGKYSLPEAPFVFDTVISETAVNSNFSDIASALTQSRSKDGQTTPTANQNYGGYRHTNIATSAGSSSRSEYVASAVAQDGGLWDAGATAGTSTAYTATLTPAITAYADKQCFRVKFNAACGANPTINFNSVGAKKIYKNVAGTETQLAANDVPEDFVGTLRYDTALDAAAGGFWLINLPDASNVPFTNTDSGLSATNVQEAIDDLAQPGRRVLISQQTLSGAVASIDFPAVFSSTYDEYEIHVFDLIPVTNGTRLRLRVSTDGSTFDSGANYWHIRIGGYTTSADGFTASSDGTGNETSGQMVNLMSNNTGHPVCGEIKIRKPTGGKLKFFEGDFTSFDGTNFFRQLQSVMYNSGTALTGFQLYASSGNIAEGIVRVYGVTK